MDNKGDMYPNLETGHLSERRNKAIQEIDLELSRQNKGVSDAVKGSSVGNYLKLKLAQGDDHEFDYVKKIFDRMDRKYALQFGAGYIKNCLENFDALDEGKIQTIKQFIDGFSISLGQEFSAKPRDKKVMEGIHDALNDMAAALEERDARDIVELYRLKVKARDLKEQLQYVEQGHVVLKEWRELLSRHATDEQTLLRQREVVEKYFAFKDLLAPNPPRDIVSKAGQNFADKDMGAMERFVTPVNKDGQGKGLLSNIMKLIKPITQERRSVEKPNKGMKR